MSLQPEIDSARAVRFVASYSGDPGPAFREAMAEHFGVTVRAVERALPRLVAAGVLAEETLPGRGRPKRYTVTTAASERKWRTLYSRGDARARRYPPGLPRAAKQQGITADRFHAAWLQGSVAYCTRCGYSPLPFWKTDPTPACINCSDKTDDGRSVPRPLLRAPGYPDG